MTEIFKDYPEKLERVGRFSAEYAVMRNLGHLTDRGNNNTSGENMVEVEVEKDTVVPVRKTLDQIATGLGFPFVVERSDSCIGYTVKIVGYDTDESVYIARELTVPADFGRPPLKDWVGIHSDSTNYVLYRPKKTLYKFAYIQVNSSSWKESAHFYQSEEEARDACCPNVEDKIMRLDYTKIEVET